MKCLLAAITERVRHVPGLRLARNEGWVVNHKRIERLWRRECLKVPATAEAAAVVGCTTDPVFGCGRINYDQVEVVAAWREHGDILSC